MRRAHAIALALVAGCSGAAPREHTRARTLALDLSLSPAHAEVWAWDVEVHGSADAPAALASCHVAVEGAIYAAELEGARFRARVRLRPGTNRARAECTDTRGGAHASPFATLDARLRDAPTARVSASMREIGRAHV